MQSDVSQLSVEQRRKLALSVVLPLVGTKIDCWPSTSTGDGGADTNECNEDLQENDTGTDISSTNGNGSLSGNRSGGGGEDSEGIMIGRYEGRMRDEMPLLLSGECADTKNNQSSTSTSSSELKQKQKLLHRPAGGYRRLLVQPTATSVQLVHSPAAATSSSQVRR